MTNEIYNDIKLKPCPNCDSYMASEENNLSKSSTDDIILALKINQVASLETWSENSENFKAFIMSYNLIILLINISTVRLSNSAMRRYWTIASLYQKFIVFTVHKSA